MPEDSFLLCQKQTAIVGGLIGINDTWFRDQGIIKADLNTIKTAGCYRVSEESTNSPSTYGILVVFYTNKAGAQDSGGQIFFSDNHIYMRALWYGQWRTWIQI